MENIVVGIIDVEPIHTEGANCYEDCLITAANYFNRDGMPMFSERWNYNIINYSDGSEHRLGEKIEVIQQNGMANYRSYSGIELKAIDCKTYRKTLSKINAELEHLRPCIIFIDGFWNPWERNYQKRHFYYHVCLVVGVEKESRRFVCVDPFYKLKNVYLPFYNFQQGYRADIITFVSTKHYNEITGWKEIVKKGLDRYSLDSINNILSGLTGFANEIEREFDLQIELSGNEKQNIRQAPICVNIKQIRHNGKVFIEFLKHLTSKFGAVELLPIIEDLNLLVTKWDLFRTLIMKYAFQDEFDVDRIKLSGIIREIAEIEKKTALDSKQIIT